MALEATPKRARPSGGSSTAAGDPDRLSALPDCLLHTIMSFMKARQVVQTCVLSTRWKHLWRSTPCLDLDLDEFKTVELPWACNKEWEDFEDFTVNLMLRRNMALLDSFRLSVSSRLLIVPKNASGGQHIVPKNAGAWVRRAIKYGTHPSSQREGLSSNSWRLKRMHLCGVFLDNLFAGHVSSACHSLEDLELKDCFCELRAITSHSLKNLVLKNCCFTGLSDITSPTLKSLLIYARWNASDCLLLITTPAVACLCLEVEHFGDGISINEMPSLDKASIRLPGFSEFKFLCSVRHLELSNLKKMMFSEESPVFKEFSNLRNLLLDNCYLRDDFKTLALFLQNSPRLEKLTLRRCKFPKPNKRLSCQCCSLDVRCVNLKLTEIISKDDDDVRQLVELLLRISGKLQKNHLKLTKVD